jgi:hypothetical protein
MFRDVLGRSARSDRKGWNGARASSKARAFVFAAMSAFITSECAPDESRTRSEPDDSGQNEGLMPTKPIADVIRDHGEEILAMPGVTVVYEGILANGTPCITVGVVDLRDENVRAIPKSLEGYVVSLHETGAIGPR